MNENNEQIPHHETEKPRPLPWSNADDILVYRKTLVESDGSGSQEDILNKQRIEVFNTLLQRLPEDDIVLATELYSLLATDDSESIRVQVADHAHCLYIHDKEVGTALFTCLINDTEPTIRDRAFAAIDDACLQDKISYSDFKELRESYYDACDRAAIREGLLKPRLITAEQQPWKARLEPWSISVETAISYIADLESKQRNARESVAFEDFYTSLRHLPRENTALAIELLAKLATHNNRDIRARIPSVCAAYLYAYEPKAAIDIAHILQQDQDVTIAQSVKTAFESAVAHRGYDHQEVMRLLGTPAVSAANRPPLRLIIGGG